MRILPAPIISSALLMTLTLAVVARPAHAEFLTFEDITLGDDGTASVFGFYQAPGSDFRVSGDFQARGEGALFSLTPETSEGSGMITTSLAPFGGTAVTLTNTADVPFTLASIDLARENLFNNPPNNGILYPEVTFTGTRVGGGTVMQTFDVDQVGFFFETFLFDASFTDLVSVSWQQPPFGSTSGSPGLHQFDNIQVVPIPEPGAATLLAIGGMAMAAGFARHRRQARDL